MKIKFRNSVLRYNKIYHKTLRCIRKNKCKKCKGNITRIEKFLRPRFWAIKNKGVDKNLFNDIFSI